MARREVDAYTANSFPSTGQATIITRWCPQKLVFNEPRKCFIAIGTDSEEDIKGLFDDVDVNSAKLGGTVAKRNEKLAKLLYAIGDLPLNQGFTENTIDLFGDAYEYLMQMYASQAGKSGGEYYTPQEVSELLARITVQGKQRVSRVYETFMPRRIQTRANYDLAA